MILCKTDDTIECVPEKWRGKCVQMTDVAVEPRDAAKYMVPKRYDEGVVNYVMAGTLVGWRTMDVLIDAWAAMSHTEDISLTENNISLTECTERTEDADATPACLSPTDDTDDTDINASHVNGQRSTNPLSLTECTDNTENLSAYRTRCLTSSKTLGGTHGTAVAAPAGNSQFSIFNFIAKGSKTFGSQLLTIVGDGPERGRLERMVDDLGLRESVRFVGQVDMETYYSYIAQADVVVNSCFREGAVTVSFDSMAMGKPLICFDTGGYTHYFAPEYSRVIKGVKSRTEAVERLAQAMAELADRELCAQMGAEAKRKSGLYDWGHKGIVIKDLIEKHV